MTNIFTWWCLLPAENPTFRHSKVAKAKLSENWLKNIPAASHIYGSAVILLRHI